MDRRDESPDMSFYFNAVKRSRVSILLITLTCVLLGVLYIKVTEPVYRASAKILADPRPPSASKDEQNVSAPMVLLYYQTQYEILQSRAIAETVVDKLDLVSAHLNEQTEKGPSKGFSSLFREEPKSKTDAAIKTMLAEEIRENLYISGGKKSQIIRIEYEDSDPSLAAGITNAIAEAYIEFGLESRLGEVKNTEAWLGEQFNQLRDDLQSAEERLVSYRVEQGLVDTEQQQVLASSQFESLNRELISAQTQLSAAEEQYLVIRDAEPGSNELLSLGPVLDNQTARELVREKARLSQRVTELSERYGEKHPKMIAARSELGSANDNLLREVDKILENIKKNYKLAQLQVTNIEKLINESKDNVQSLQSENLSLVSLERDVENKRRVYENFQASLLEQSRKSEFTASNVNIIDSAVVPEFPVKPSKKAVLILSALFGLFLGIARVLIKLGLNDKFDTVLQLEERTGLSVLGASPFVKQVPSDASIAWYYLSQPRSTFAENINTIRTSLLFSNIDHPPKTILVASSTSEEGKSTLASNLASAYSQIGRTLLLEVDLRKPSLGKNLDIENALGLSDILVENRKYLDEVVEYKNDKKLSILTCGTLPHNPMELLMSAKFDEFFGELKGLFDYIVLDGPPALPVSDSNVLSSKVDAVILAVKAGATSIKTCRNAMARLNKSNAPIVGAVLSQADERKMASYGDYYGAYYGDEPETEPQTS